MLPYYFLVCVFMTFQKGRRRKSTRFGIWSTWLMFGDLLQKKDEDSKTARWHFIWGGCFLRDLDDPICWTWMLYAGCVLSFSVTIRIPPPCPSWGWAVIWWGCSPYPAHLHPNKNIWQDWHPTPARAYSHNPWRCSRYFFEGICWEMLTSGFEGCFGRLFIKSRCSANVERIWSTHEATASPPALAFRETN